MVERSIDSRVDGTSSCMVAGVVNGKAGRHGPARSSSHEIPHQPLRIASLNVGTLRGRSSEVVETLTRRQVDICCLQEMRWRGGSAHVITGENS